MIVNRYHALALGPWPLGVNRVRLTYTQESLYLIIESVSIREGPWPPGGRPTLVPPASPVC